MHRPLTRPSRLRPLAIGVALWAWAFIPLLAGGLRLAQLAAGGPVTADNARFFSAPAPVVVHIVGSTVFSLLGALQFLPGRRRRPAAAHRAMGYLVVVAGEAVALSGLWMACRYAIIPADGPLLHALRLGFGTAMAVALARGLGCARRGEVERHQAWMRRAYALGMGAGTQALILLPVHLLFGAPGEWARAALMGLGWVLNLGGAEVINRAALAATLPGPAPAPRERA